ncbi:MAG: sugar phosphate isomerase/epimerase family protein, partial [Tepidisphaerales bacterium]
KYVSIKDFHLAMKSTTEQRKETVAKFKAAGITPLSVGVVTFPKDEAVCRAAFEYARDCGVPVIVANPVPEALPAIEKLVKEFDIRIAIHNHGPEDKRWPTPNSAIEAIRNLDPRIGICIDVGHTARAGVDPAKAMLDFADRLFDVHIKDISDPKGKGASAELEVGRGVLNQKAMLSALLKIKFAGHLGLEYEKDAADPLPGIGESIGFIRGVASTLEA